MGQRVKCNELGCEMCKKGKILKKTHNGETVYYCKSSKEEITRKKAKECIKFRCKAEKQYFCKSCNGGVKIR